MRIKQYLIICFVAILFFLIFFLYIKTGFLQKDKIDKEDFQFWNYTNEGIIPGTESFFLKGNSSKCWIMIHGYTSTPDELREAANAVNNKFNDSVYAIRLYGHGMPPSNLLNYTIFDWYNQIKETVQRNRCTYLLGSSMGAGFVLRYAEEYSIEGIVLLGIPLKMQPSYLPTEIITKTLYKVSGYMKKKEPRGTISDPELKKKHISTFAFPLKAVIEFEEQLKPLILNDLEKVRSRVLFLHAEKDSVVDINAARAAYEKINSTKEFFTLEGDHIILRDRDKERAIQKIIEFRKHSPS